VSDSESELGKPTDRQYWSPLWVVWVDLAQHCTSLHGTVRRHSSRGAVWCRAAPDLVRKRRRTPYRRFPVKLIPTLNYHHHLVGPLPRELDVRATMTRTPDPWWIRDALIGRIPNGASGDVAMSEVGSRSSWSNWAWEWTHASAGLNLSAWTSMKQSPELRVVCLTPHASNKPHHKSVAIPVRQLPLEPVVCSLFRIGDQVE